MIGNGIAGFAICEEELISVHKNNKKAAQSEVKHILPKMVRTAFKYGAKYGDCYGEFLANYYMSNGFIAVAKVEFDALSDNPETWDFSKFGKPYIYMLVRGVKNVAELDRLKANNEIVGFDEVRDTVKFFKTIEECEAYRNETYDKIKNFGYKKSLKFIKSL